MKYEISLNLCKVSKWGLNQADKDSRMDSCESRSRSTYNDGYRLGFYFKCL